MTLVALLGTATASANFNVNDEHTGQRFLATQYYSVPYECAAPCAFSFEAIRACSSGNASFTWGIRNGADQPIYGAFGPAWRYEFAALGDYTVWETEQVTSQTSSCATGGTFRLRVVDKTPPDTSITYGPSALTADSTPSFGFTATEPGATFACRFDDAAFTPCVSPLEAARLTPGNHAFEVRASDAAWNIDPTPARRSFRIADRTAPGLELAARSPLSMRAVLLRGVPVTVATDEPGTITMRLSPADRKTARRLKFKRSAEIGALSRKVQPGTTVVRVKLSRKARTQLQGVTHAELRLVATIRDAAGNARTKTLRVTLNRKVSR